MDYLTHRLACIGFSKMVVIYKYPMIAERDLKTSSIAMHQIFNTFKKSPFSSMSYASIQ
jgi:hypothetical protein